MPDLKVVYNLINWPSGTHNERLGHDEEDDDKTSFRLNSQLILCYENNAEAQTTTTFIYQSTQEKQEKRVEVIYWFECIP